MSSEIHKNTLRKLNLRLNLEQTDFVWKASKELVQYYSSLIKSNNNNNNHNNYNSNDIKEVKELITDCLSQDDKRKYSAICSELRCQTSKQEKIVNGLPLNLCIELLMEALERIVVSQSQSQKSHPNNSSYNQHEIIKCLLFFFFLSYQRKEIDEYIDHTISSILLDSPSAAVVVLNELCSLISSLSSSTTSTSTSISTSTSTPFPFPFPPLSRIKSKAEIENIGRRETEIFNITTIQNDLIAISAPILSTIAINQIYKDCRIHMIHKLYSLITSSFMMNDEIKFDLLNLQLEIISFVPIDHINDDGSNFISEWMLAILNMLISISDEELWNILAERFLSLLFKFYLDFNNSQKNHSTMILFQCLESFIIEFESCDMLIDNDMLPVLGYLATLCDSIDERNRFMKILSVVVDFLYVQFSKKNDKKLVQSISFLVYPIISWANNHNSDIPLAGIVLENYIYPIFKNNSLSSFTSIDTTTTKNTKTTTRIIEEKDKLHKYNKHHHYRPLLLNVVSLETSKSSLLQFITDIFNKIKKGEISDKKDLDMTFHAILSLFFSLFRHYPLLLSSSLSSSEKLDDQEEEEEKKIISLIIETLGLFLETVPMLTSRLLPSLLFVINLCEDSVIILEILYMIPRGGKHQVCCKQIMNLIKILHKGDESINERKQSLSHSVSQPLPYLSSVAIRMCTKLYEINSSLMFQNFCRLIYDNTSSSKITKNFEDLHDEIRIAKMISLYDIAKYDSESALEFVALLQKALKDEHPFIVSCAIHTLSILCQEDCLDFNATFKVLKKSEKLNNYHNPLVRISLAIFVKSAKVISEEEEEEEEDEAFEEEKEDKTASLDNNLESDSDSSTISSSASSITDDLIEMKLLRQLYQFLSSAGDNGNSFFTDPDSRVRLEAFRSLASLVKDIFIRSDDDRPIRKELFLQLTAALYQEKNKEIRLELCNIIGPIIKLESEDISTWSRAKLMADTAAKMTNKPSRKLIASLPKYKEMLQRYNTTERGNAGFANAILFCSNVSIDNFNEFDINNHNISIDELNEKRKELKSLLIDLMTDEDSLSRCQLQRFTSSCAYLRFLSFFFDISVASEKIKLKDQSLAISSASKSILGIIVGAKLPDSCSFAVALAGLANALPEGFSHIIHDIINILKEEYQAARLKSKDLSMLKISLGLSAKRLPLTEGKYITEIYKLLQEDFQLISSKSKMYQDWNAFGTPISLAMLTEWCYKAPHSSIECNDLLCNTLVQHLYLLKSIFPRENIMSEVIDDKMMDRFSKNLFERNNVQSWEEISSSLISSHFPKNLSTFPTTALSGINFGFMLLCPLLENAGMDSHLLQLFHLLRALKRLSLSCPVGIGLSATVVSCARRSLISRSDIFDCIRIFTDEIDKEAPEEGLCIGLVNIIKGVERLLVFPKGFIPQVVNQLLLIIENENDHTTSLSSTGTRVNCLFALCQYIGLQIMNAPYDNNSGEISFADENVPGIISSMMQISENMISSMDWRLKDAGARVLGYLTALRQSGLNVKDQYQKGTITVKELDSKALRVPAEGTLLHILLIDLLKLINNEDHKIKNPISFIKSAIKSLLWCKKLSFSHQHFVLLLQTFIMTYADEELDILCFKFSYKNSSSSDYYTNFITELIKFSINGNQRLQKVVTLNLIKIMVTVPAVVLENLLSDLWNSLLKMNKNLVEEFLKQISKFLSMKERKKEISEKHILAVLNIVDNDIINFFFSDNELKEFWNSVIVYNDTDNNNKNNNKNKNDQQLTKYYAFVSCIQYLEDDRLLSILNIKNDINVEKRTLIIFSLCRLISNKRFNTTLLEHIKITVAGITSTLDDNIIIYPFFAEALKHNYTPKIVCKWILTCLELMQVNFKNNNYRHIENSIVLLAYIIDAIANNFESSFMVFSKLEMDKVDKILLSLHRGFPKLLSSITLPEDIILQLISNLEKYLSSIIAVDDKKKLYYRDVLIVTLTDVLKSTRYYNGSTTSVLTNNPKYISIVTKACLYNKYTK